MEETKTPAALPLKKFSLTSISFLVGLLLFLLPFVEIKCNGQTFATNTGIGLAFGTGYKTIGQSKSSDNPFGEKPDKTIIEKEKGKLYAFALVALILGAAGLILSLTRATPGKALVFIGGLAAISLIVLMIQIQTDVKEKPVSGRENTIANDLRVTAEFTAWYYLSLVSFILAAVLSYRRKPRLIPG